MTAAFEAAFADLPVIAILRGLEAADAAGALNALVEGGIRLAEVPLNGPEPFCAIEEGARIEGLVVGAGTVLSADDVQRSVEAGAQYIIAPNFSPEVVAAANDLDVPAIPGVFTPTEVFAALDAGAFALKLFPAELVGRPGLKALRAVVPPGTGLIPVGGVSADNVRDWRHAGAGGVGVGSALYSPGIAPEEINTRARHVVVAWNCQ